MRSCVLFVFGNDHSVGAMCAYVDVLGVWKWRLECINAFG